MMLSAKQSSIKYHFWVSGMTRPEIEPQSPGPLVNTLLVSSIAVYTHKQFYLKQFILAEVRSLNVKSSSILNNLL